MPRRFQNPIEVLPNVLEGLEAVRVSWATDMGDYAWIQTTVVRLGYPETVRWLEWHRCEYSEGLFCGFVEEEPYFDMDLVLRDL